MQIDKTFYFEPKHFCFIKIGEKTNLQNTDLFKKKFFNFSTVTADVILAL